MDAPEKIYITPHFQRRWFTKDIDDKSIEYIRKDAFIEKACKLLARMVWEVTYEDLEGNSVEHHDKIEFIIEDLKKYMKGE